MQACQMFQWFIRCHEEIGSANFFAVETSVPALAMPDVVEIPTIVEEQESVKRLVVSSQGTRLSGQWNRC